MRPAAVSWSDRPVLCCRHCTHEFPHAVWQHLPLEIIGRVPCFVCRKDEAGAVTTRAGEYPSPKQVAEELLERIAAL